MNKDTKKNDVNRYVNDSWNGFDEEQKSYLIDVFNEAKSSMSEFERINAGFYRVPWDGNTLKRRGVDDEPDTEEKIHVNETAKKLHIKVHEISVDDYSSRHMKGYWVI